ncbi:Protein translocase subunit secE [Granulibacter bethesdensis]|uniref:Protein translocase subunit SecE n=2 Tax=Granulibacter bethesdensis TaxID=364410 RepID=Q0BQG2_GRABC|nr:Protein translocase subunit secE [Granulibacter bethesdensis CGDNIH1]AHJ63933.1 Protein translocase subunit secE [Granulibacter bethesdensis]AHJ65487.1 Protein translocase subunit secE [Granulibacter bethesdensis CGDNIH4]AHJ68100.1 Protein translocase subunit secE [Granulibacter bethesdensis]APH52809.1 Protein translocase subunit secE [Granulibacter bethesdensis]
MVLTRNSAAFLRSKPSVATSPAKFLRDVRSEVSKVTWPSRKETLVTTGLVFAMATLAAAFFFVIDQLAGLGISLTFASGG